MLKCAKDELKIIYADAVRSNTRIIHILEKLGFQHVDDENMINYKLEL